MCLHHFQKVMLKNIHAENTFLCLFQAGVFEIKGHICNAQNIKWNK
jgi:hypothetical protein